MQMLETESKNMAMLPCPFCGNADVECRTEFEISGYGGTEHYAVCCDATKSGCGATGSFSAKKEDAIERWNRRVYDTEMNPMSGDMRILSENEISAIRMCRDICAKCKNNVDQQAANAMLVSIFQVLEPG